MGDVPARGSAVCAREPRRAAEGRAEGVAEPARGVRAGREGVAPTGVACGAGCAWVDAGILVSGTVRMVIWAPLPDYVDENVSDKVGRIVPSYVGVVNKRWSGARGRTTSVTDRMRFVATGLKLCR